MRRLSIAVIAAAATNSLTQMALAADITRPAARYPVTGQTWVG
jgi:hypothetical protein